MEFYKKIGDEVIHLSINNTIYNEFIELFLPDAIAKNTTYKIKVNYKEGVKKRVDLKNYDYDKIELSNSNYYYLSEERMYLVEGYCFAGIVDVERREITWDLWSEIDPRSMLHLFVLDPISLLSPQFDFVVCHGAVLKKEERAIILFGNSGAGKSTISRMITEEIPEIDKVADDTFGIKIKDGEILVYPFNTGEGFLKSNNYKYNSLIEKQGGKGIILENNKKCYIYKKIDISKPLILKKILYLDNRKQIEITEIKRCSSVESLKYLLSFHTSIPSEHTRKKFLLWTYLSNKTEGYSTEYLKNCDIEKIKTMLELWYEEWY